MHKCAHVHECTVLWQQVCPLHTTEVNQLLPLSQEKQLKRFIVSATSASVFLPKTKSRTPNPPCHPYPCSSFYFVVQIAGIIRNQQKDAMQSQTLFLKKGRKKQKDLIIVTTCLFFAFLNLCAHTLAVSAEILARTDRGKCSDKDLRTPLTCLTTSLWSEQKVKEHLHTSVL